MRKSKNSIIILIVAILSFFNFTCSAKAKYVVVIDAGHGGKDVGAVDNEIKEKDINLEVALRLGDMIKDKLKNVKVVYTRDKDTYLTLQDRADVANKSKGDLFISIHTNSVDKSNKNRTTISGASTYTLGLHKDQNNMAVARRENSVISLESNYAVKYQGFNPESDESYIIFEMAQKSNLNQSIKFADKVQRHLVKEAGRRDRGVHQAGFWVLWATSMPSVLVELDFICNPNSAKYIASKEGQYKLAGGIFKAVKEYFEQLDADKNSRVDIDNASDNTDDFSSQVIIDSSFDKTHRIVSDAPNKNDTNKNGIAKRRRRTESSRRASSTREIEIAQIVVQADNSEEVAVTQQLESQNNDSNLKKEKNKNKRKQKRNKSNVTPRLNVYYTVRLFESSDLLKPNDTIFKNVGRIAIKEVENGRYAYVCGVCDDKNEVSLILDRVKNRFPDAAIVKVNKGTNQIVN